MSLPIHRGGLQKALVFGRQPVNPGGQHSLHRGRHLKARQGLDQAIRPTLAAEHLGFDQCPHTFLQEQGIPLSALDQEVLERYEAPIVPQQRLQEGLGALR